MTVDQETDDLNIYSLKQGTHLSIETSNSVYEIDILENHDLQISGGTRCDGEVRFKTPTPMILHGSTWGGPSIKLDYICVGMNMEMSFKDHESITTSKVRKIKITD